MSAVTIYTTNRQHTEKGAKKKLGVSSEPKEKTGKDSIALIVSIEKMGNKNKVPRVVSKSFSPLPASQPTYNPPPTLYTYTHTHEPFLFFYLKEFSTVARKRKRQTAQWNRITSERH